MTTDRFSFLRRPASLLAVGLAVVAALAWLVFSGGAAKPAEGGRWVAVQPAPWFIRSAWSGAWSRGGW